MGWIGKAVRESIVYDIEEPDSAEPVAVSGADTVDEMPCPACGAACESSYNFCFACGYQLGESVDLEKLQQLFQERSIECQLEIITDDVGHFCIFELIRPLSLSSAYGDAFGTVQILDGQDEWIGGRPPFQNTDGEFEGTVPIENNSGLFFLPFGAVRHLSSGNYRLVFEVFCTLEEDCEPVSHGSAVFDIELQQVPDNWKVGWLKPLIDVCMRVVRADGRVVSEEVRLVKEYMVQILDLTQEDISQLKNAMKDKKSNAPSSSFAKIMQRLPNLHPVDLLDLLSDVAKSDGEIHSSEVEVIQEVALAAGLSAEQWVKTSEHLGLHAGIPQRDQVKTGLFARRRNNLQYAYEVLGIAPEATKVEIAAAYRNLVSDYHPDRVANLPKAFQDMAYEKMTRINAAYDMLKTV